MALKKYPASIHPNPQESVSSLLLNSRGVTSGPAASYLPANLKKEILELAQERGMKGDDYYEASYWVIKDLHAYPKLCAECGTPVQFRSFSEAYMYDRCSTKCSNGSGDVKRKKEQKTFDNYGVKHHFAAPSIKSKMKKNHFEKYGVESNMQLEGVFKKNMRAQYRLKPVILPSGRMVEMMGYEPQAIEWLFKRGYFENDIQFNDIPTVKYHFEGKRHSYRADLYIPAKNTLVEVKSSWTLQADADKNEAKAQGAALAGFNHWLIVLDEKGNLLEERMTNASSV